MSFTAQRRETDFWDFFVNERKLAKGALLFLFVLSVVAYFLSDYYVTDIFAFDWYNSKAMAAYKMLNFTYIRIVENIILLVCCYLNR